MPLSIGIDPGPSSGACIAIDGISYYSEISLGCSYRQLARWFYRHKNADIVVCELVHARPMMGITSQAKLVASMERACQAACVIDVDPIMIRPTDWQVEFDLIYHTDKKLTKHQRKKAKKAIHQQRIMELMEFWDEDGNPMELDVEKADAALLAYRGLLLLEKDRAVIEH